MSSKKVIVSSDVYLVPRNPHEIRNQMIRSLSSTGDVPDYSTCQLCGSVLPIGEVMRGGRFRDTVCQQCREDCGEPDEGWIDELEASLDSQQHRVCNSCQLAMPIGEFHRLHAYWLCGLCMMLVHTMLMDKTEKAALEKAGKLTKGE